MPSEASALDRRGVQLFCGYLVAGGDLGERAGGLVDEAVVVEHDPGPGHRAVDRHAVLQLRHH